MPSPPRGWRLVSVVLVGLTLVATLESRPRKRRPPPSTPGSIVLTPGQSLQAAVNAAPEGATFWLTAGVYRLQHVAPKSFQVFQGAPGAIVSGARLLTTFLREGPYWVATGQTQQGPAPGECMSTRPRCRQPEDVYVNDVRLEPVTTLAAVGPGRWYFDYAGDRIYLADDPTGRRVETTVLPAAFTGSASGVRIEGLIIEKYASPAQAGAIQGWTGTNWTLDRLEVRFNHGIGIRLGQRMTVRDSRVHRNGQLGIGGTGDDVLVERNEIAFNNTAGYNPFWEAGGTKFVRTNGLVVRNNVVHHNEGPGLWTDIDNSNSLYEGNRVEDNRHVGIFHEISYAAVIRNNSVRRNGFAFSVWVLGAGILVSASPDVEIYGNTVEDNANGITGVQQARGSGIHGPWQISNLWVHHNTVRMAQGLTGLAQDVGDRSYFTTRNNRFNWNTYYLGARPRYFAWLDAERTEVEWRAFGQDLNGTFVR